MKVNYDYCVNFRTLDPIGNIVSLSNVLVKLLVYTMIDSVSHSVSLFSRWTAMDRPTRPPDSAQFSSDHRQKSD